VTSWPWTNLDDDSEACIVVKDAKCAVVKKRWSWKTPRGQLLLAVNSDKGWQTFIGKDERECRKFLAAAGFVEEP